MIKHLFSDMPKLNTILLFILTITFSTHVFAQKEVENAKAYLQANAAQFQLSKTDIEEMGVSSAYLSTGTSLYHIYFAQKYQAIEVFNGILNVTLLNDKVVNVGNTFVPNINSKVPAITNTLGLSPAEAIDKAAAYLKLATSTVSTQEVSTNKLPNGQIDKAVYRNAALSNDEINVKLYWFPYDTLINRQRVSKIDLVWQVQIQTKDQKNVWSVQVNAQSGEIVQVKDLVIHCNFGTPEHQKTPHVCKGIVNTAIKANETIGFMKSVAANSYRVFDYPVESPIHGSQTVVTNPYTKFAPTGTGPGSTNGWHNDGTTDYTNTRGNNVWAQEDKNGNNGTGASPSSATLEFDYSYTHATGSANANLNAAITNLFYWNNLIHDVLYKYGFNEAAGNFQRDNMGRGGLGNDFVYADAQDGSGTNNANFYPPIDGINGRMQMFLWNQGGSPAYQPDSDFDNGVIVHEYGHGWSTRLTGGPANSSCLQNVEQGGEGWSDYLGLMLTTNWAALQPNAVSANRPVSIGTYVLGQETTDDGIRGFKYSHDMGTYNAHVTYGQVGNISFSNPHGIGSIWATILWDMTWKIIMLDNKIVSNINKTDSLLGNVAALKLVNQGLALQPCSPSMIQARNAILKADTLLFNARYSCVIWEAFARRGLGIYASTGVSANDRIVTEDFTPYTARPLSSDKVLSACSRTPFVYTATTSVAGTTFSWTRPAVPGISNAAGSGNSANINESLINTTDKPIIVLYYFSLTPGTCNALQTVRVVVNPEPVPAVDTYNVCKNGTVPAGQGVAIVNPISSSFSGTLTGLSPVYRRPLGDNVTTYNGASGTSYRYFTYSFISPVTASVSIETIDGTINTDRYDTYLSLYKNSFNSTTPANNFLIGDDDSGALLYASKITYNLVKDSTYIVVVTTYAQNATGSFVIGATAPIFSNIVTWYTANTGGTALAKGSVFNPVGVPGSGVPNTATVGTNYFYADASNLSACRVMTRFIVNSPSVGGTIAGSTTACSNTNSGTLTLSGYTGTILRWESSTDNFVSNVVSIPNTTTSLNYSNLTQTTYYRAVIKSGDCPQANSSVATITRTNVTLPTTTGGSRCGAGTVTLAATGCAGGTINWYDGITGGTSLATGTSFTTPALSASKTYYAACTISTCVSNRVAAMATVNIATAPTASGASRCGTGSVTLSATGCAGGTINWYTVATGGTAVSTGGTYATPSLSSNTTYYVGCTVGACSSARTTVQATINVNLLVTGAQVAGSYRASQTITSTANVASGVNYYAAKAIILNPGFQAGGNEIFMAKIQNCP